ncbi:sirohydrochlorin chelatase [Comamonas endophytica]|uniref:CbiX/SirB N-terminal domain-containing protein n=1 Tax=Comamonas endophytica TaxID=2949090 RepID=A0ABY6GBA8_9BURK|nr:MULTISPECIES: CbiX/SirB N-terminal domain-containing protein [unclassified Acidovorax]MCD2511973.1 CbiX/SirB N-terminal domain-containing protein [Acidovorax sp. D4N7]UYG51681.1 CbiX/SirB N-terminal domain-containing protein [Acidovorax sp. 5MLIR]UYG51754.1 CbiX/SirB N-terminal domain-containing protein [Acidovorax sp. 5MLIR]
MTSPAPTCGVILLGHGSRDPLWRAPIEAVQARIAQAQPQTPCCCAYLELTAPDLGQAADQLIARGVQRLRITPMFLGTGKHAREDIPRLVAELKARHPGIAVEVQASVGEDARVTALLAQIATESSPPTA